MPSTRISTLLAVSLFFPPFFANARAGEAPPEKPEAKISEEEILAKEAEALEAYKREDYIRVFDILAGLHENGVDVMSRSAGKMFMENSLNKAYRMKDRTKRMSVLEAFLRLDLKIPPTLEMGAGFFLIRDRCLERVHLDKVEKMAVKYERMHEDWIEDKKGETPKGRKEIADHGRFVDLVGLAYYVNGNFDPKKNTFLANAKKTAVPKFTDVTEKAGLKGKCGTRIALADLDGDGKEDILIDGTIVMKNLGDGTFRDVTEEIGLPQGLAALAADLDNDGFLDLVQIGSEEDRIFLNDGLGKFKQVEDAGLKKDDFRTGGAALGDFNRDGLLDLYLAKSEHKTASQSNIAQISFDRLYFNEKKGRFKEVSGTAGIRKSAGMLGWSVSVCDWDNDGDPDIYVGNNKHHFDKNFLWENDGKGNFKNVSESRNACGKPKPYRGRSYHGHTYATAFGDVDGDGDFDLFAANFCLPKYYDVVGPSMFLFNKGREGDFAFIDRFADCGVTFLALLADCSMVDFDNDGHLDLYLSASGDFSQSDLYRNEGNGTFRDVTWQTRTPAFNAYGHAWFDYDKDGDMDLVVGSRDGIRLLRNGTPRKKGWMELNLSGSASNGSAVGTRIIVKAGKKTFLREVACGRGATSQDSLIVHFGLGRFKGKVNVEIRWPSGKVKTMKLEACRRHRIREP